MTHRYALIAKVVLFVAVVTTASFCLSCIGTRSAPVEQTPPEQPSFALQSPGEMAKSMSYSDTDRFRLGTEFDAVLPTNMVASAENYLIFQPHFDPDTHPLLNGMAYSIYNFNVAGYSDDPTVSYHWYSSNGYDDSLWLGMANWDRNVWEWFRCDETELLTLPSMEPYVHADGNVLVAMVAFDPNQDAPDINYSALQFARLGSRVGRWIIDTVDPDAQVNMVSLALDEASIPHVAYTDYEVGSSDLKYGSLRWGWATEVIQEVGDTGWFPSIVIATVDSIALPRICFVNNSEDELRVVTSTSRVIFSSEIALDWGEGYMGIDATNPQACNMILLNDNLCISYHNYDDGSLNYTYFNGLAWVNNIVDDTANVGFSNWLSANPAGQPCISYRNEDDQSLMFAEHTGMAWETSIIDPGDGNNIGMVSNLQFGIDGHPQVCYDNLTHNSTVWAYYDGADWHNETVFDLESHGQNCAMVVDSAGIPHVVTMDSDNNNLIHFWREAADLWLGEALDLGGAHPTGYCVAMAIDELDRLYIAYGGNAGAGSESALKFAYQAD